MTEVIKTSIDGVFLSELKIIDLAGGEVRHAIKESDYGYSGFGEAYFSSVKPSVIKAWKKHKVMTLNLVVCFGSVKFVIFDDRTNSPSEGLFYTVTLSQDNYYRLTVPPMLWMGFQGMSDKNSMLLNVVDIEHCPEELERSKITDIDYDWRVELSK